MRNELLGLPGRLESRPLYASANRRMGDVLGPLAFPVQSRDVVHTLLGLAAEYLSCWNPLGAGRVIAPEQQAAVHVIPDLVRAFVRGQSLHGDDR